MTFLMTLAFNWAAVFLAGLLAVAVFLAVVGAICLMSYILMDVIGLSYEQATGAFFVVTVLLIGFLLFGLSVPDDPPVTSIPTQVEQSHQ